MSSVHLHDRPTITCNVVRDMPGMYFRSHEAMPQRGSKWAGFEEVQSTESDHGFFDLERTIRHVVALEKWC